MRLRNVSATVRGPAFAGKRICQSASSVRRFGPGPYPRPAVADAEQQLEHVDWGLPSTLSSSRCGLVERRDFVEARAGIARQLNADVVYPVPRKRVTQRRAAACAERQPFEAIVLPELGRHEERIRLRRARATRRRQSS